MPNGGSRRVSSGDFWAGHVRTWQHLDVHGQPSEICALEAKYPRIGATFFLTAYFFVPAELTVAGIDSLGADRSPIPGNPRRVGVQARSSGPRSSRPTRWTRLHQTGMSLKATSGSAQPSVCLGGCGRCEVSSPKKARFTMPPLAGEALASSSTSGVTDRLHR